MAFTVKINGKQHSVDVDGDTPLLWVLRDVLAITGTKFGCGKGLCGACTVHIDGQARRSCITAIESVGDSKIMTIEAIGATGRREDPEGLARPRGRAVRLLPVRSDHIGGGAAAQHAQSDRRRHRDSAMAGNICRYGTYGRIREAIKQAARG